MGVIKTAVVFLIIGLASFVYCSEDEKDKGGDGDKFKLGFIEFTVDGSASYRLPISLEPDFNYIGCDAFEPIIIWKDNGITATYRISDYGNGYGSDEYEYQSFSLSFENKSYWACIGESYESCQSDGANGGFSISTDYQGEMHTWNLLGSFGGQLTNSENGDQIQVEGTFDYFIGCLTGDFELDQYCGC